MPPRTRTHKAPVEPDEAAPAPARHAKSDGEICGDCWPDGWSGNDSGASCIHGDWTR